MNSINYHSFFNLRKKIVDIYLKEKTPDKYLYLELLEKAIETLKSENSLIREYDVNNEPGGLVYLKEDLPTIIVPDLHARIDFFLNILFYEIDNNLTVLEELIEERLQIVCVGDAFHSEARAVKRWEKALEEFMTDFERHSNMDEEMIESLGVMEMIMETKVAASDNFHFLKGNHENILNENGNGNYPFRKFALEGHMVFRYLEKFYGTDFLEKFSTFEKNLPLLAVGKNFLVSHSEPASFYSKEEVVNFRSNPDVIEGLTWTDNNASRKGAVIDMLKAYLDIENLEDVYYFGGHRPVNSLYNLRADGKYVQLHNPNKFIIAYLKPEKKIDLSKDIIEIPDKTKNIIKTL